VANLNVEFGAAQVADRIIAALSAGGELIYSGDGGLHDERLAPGRPGPWPPNCSIGSITTTTR